VQLSAEISFILVLSHRVKLRDDRVPRIVPDHITDLTYVESTGRECFTEPVKRDLKAKRENVNAGTVFEVKVSADGQSFNLQLLARCMTDSRPIRYLFFTVLVIG